ncbi:MAG: isopentenyl-diphosphate Delta-isomerase [Bacteroidota bacterium]|nr:isopentenyl-diphosphate Delta-isomerase [Bacteroidota bacterium]
MEKVILVDKDDVEIGEMEKMEAHQKGELHRAFSIFIFNENDELMLQQRAFSKYHSGGLWTNTCCSHPRKGESTIEAAHRRLKEEMGFDCELKEIFTFTYNADVGQGLIEHEYDHVFIGKYNKVVEINTEEVEDYKFKKLSELTMDVLMSPNDFTKWFIIAFGKMIEYLNSNPL